MKKLLAIILCIVMIGTALVSCNGDNDNVENNDTNKKTDVIKTSSKGLEYEKDGHGYTVKGIGTCTDTDVVIPDTYENKPVTSIGNSAFSGCSGLTSITIPNSVTRIGGFAFKDCSGLTSITIGNGVTSIGDGAFYNCSGLTSITIGNGVTSIGIYAFYNCSGLTSITIPDSVTSIGNRAFNGCSGLTSVTFENPNGWWYSSTSPATGGTGISNSDLSNTSTAAQYLRSTYRDYYWNRS